MGTKLFVGNLSWGIDSNKLNEIFSAAGSVVEAVVIMDKFNPKKSRGFGFVTMATPEEAQKAIEMLDGSDQDGREMRVSIAEEKPRN